MPRDSAVTRSRVLKAAITEFSRYGLSGARVDRIARNAEANKRAIYDHFGNKERLFRAAVDATIERIVREVPWTPDDLPGYVGRLFDFHVAHPESIRIATWRNLERDTAVPDADLTPYKDFVAMIRSRPDGERAGAPPALDLSVMLLSLASAWVLANHDLLAIDPQNSKAPDRLAQHRAALIQAATQLLGPPPPVPES
ncbi:MAG: hypothetical protein RI885_1558 [Actinomycetota bacterium]